MPINTIKNNQVSNKFAQVSDNFAKIRLWHLGVAVGVFALLLGALTLFTDTQTYPQINKDIFITINALWQHAPPPPNSRTISRS